MASATTMLLALVPAGGHIVTTTDCYRRTRQVGAALGGQMLSSSLVPADRLPAERQFRFIDLCGRAGNNRRRQRHCCLCLPGMLSTPPHSLSFRLQFIQQFLPKMGIGATVIDPSDLAALEDALERYPVSCADWNAWFHAGGRRETTHKCNSTWPLVCLCGHSAAI